MKRVLVLIATIEEAGGRREYKKRENIPGFRIVPTPEGHEKDYLHRLKLANDSNFKLLLLGPLTGLIVFIRQTVLIEESS